MSVSKWSYRPEICDGDFCVGDCDLCDKPRNMEDEDEKYSIIETAERLGIKVRTVRDWIRRGKIHAEKPEGVNKWLITGDEISRIQYERQHKNKKD